MGLALWLEHCFLHIHMTTQQHSCCCAFCLCLIAGSDTVSRHDVGSEHRPGAVPSWLSELGLHQGRGCTCVNTMSLFDFMDSCQLILFSSIIFSLFGSWHAERFLWVIPGKLIFTVLPQIWISTHYHSNLFMLIWLKKDPPFRAGDLLSYLLLLPSQTLNP